MGRGYERMAQRVSSGEGTQERARPPTTDRKAKPNYKVPFVVSLVTKDGQVRARVPSRQGQQVPPGTLVGA